MSTTRVLRTTVATLCVAAIAAAAAPTASAAPLLINGGFESGMSAWTRVDQLGSDGSFAHQSGTSSPANGVPVPAPPEGTFAAMSEGQAGGSRVLYQDFLVPLGVTAGTVSFQLFIDNDSLATDFFVPDPATLDFATIALNQQARVDIMTVSADPFSVAGADVLLNLFQTNPGDPMTSGYSLVSADISALLAANAGQTLRLRFTAVDNVAPLRVGVDAVSIETGTVPEPTTLAMLGLASLLVGVRRRH